MDANDFVLKTIGELYLEYKIEHERLKQELTKVIQERDSLLKMLGGDGLTNQGTPA